METVQKMDKRSFSQVADKKHSAGFHVNIIFEGQPTLLDQLLAPLRRERDHLPRAVYQFPCAQKQLLNVKEGVWLTSTR